MKVSKESFTRMGDRTDSREGMAMATPWPPLSFVERLGALTKKGEHRTKTHRHYPCACDVCGRATYLPTNRIALKCRMTPRCEGHHRKEDS